MTDENIHSNQMFEKIKHIDDNGIEYWEARELQKALGYKQWRRFNDVIERAKVACENSHYKMSDHFAIVGKMSKRAKNACVEIKDYKLSRYACYLIVQNGDSKKEVIALGQTYFAIQTRRQEIQDLQVKENEKRLYRRNMTRQANYQLNQVAKKAGVKNFGAFHNAGYQGLYAGETANDIFKRKGLNYREDILDYMCSDELAANIFRISLAKQKIDKEGLKGEILAKQTHYFVGQKVRNTIQELGGMMPEQFPTPDKSLKELEREQRRELPKKN